MIKKEIIPCRLTGEKMALIDEAEMMVRMSGRINNVKIQDIRLTVGDEPFLFYRFNRPIVIRKVTQNLSTPCQELGWINHMPEAVIMDYHAGHGEMVEEIRKTAGVINMDVRKQYIIDPFHIPFSKGTQESSH